MSAAQPEVMSDRNGWKPWYGPVALVFGLVAATVSQLAIFLIRFGNPTQAELNHPPPAIVDAATIAQDVCFVLVAVWIASWVARPRPAQFGMRSPRVAWWQALLAVVGAYGAFLVWSSIWAVLFNTNAQEKYLVKEVGGTAGATGAFAAVLVFCVVAPICEEFLFRGFIFGALRNWRGPWVAALLTGILFGAIHYGSAPAVDLVPLGGLGMLLCGVRQLTGSLYPAIALHLVNNAIALGVDEGWGWQIPVTIVAAAAAVSLVIALMLRATRVRFA
ncbi:MAG: CPBP family intramembrane glutamic endopeptidase [Solirubrobacteraceae bacterium]